MTEYRDYAWEKEDHEYLNALPTLPMKSAEWTAFSRPKSIDVDWHKTENQLQIGSCQGNSLTSAVERTLIVRGVKIQLSRIFAYLATQKIDGLLGSDRGSTISGGCKLAVEVGCPPETLTGYPNGYPGRTERDAILSAANYEQAAAYKALSAWKVPDNHEELLDFIGGGGAVNFGIRYYASLIPQDRVVRSYRPWYVLGGHAMAVLGYDADGNLLAVNSHGDGKYTITPAAWRQMLADRSTAAIGLMGSTEPEPIDWYSNSPYFK